MNEIFSVIITYYAPEVHEYKEEVYGNYTSESKAHEIADKIREKARFKVEDFVFGYNGDSYDIYDVRVTLSIVDEQPFDEDYFEGEAEC